MLNFFFEWNWLLKIFEFCFNEFSNKKFQKCFNTRSWFNNWPHPPTKKQGKKFSRKIIFYFVFHKEALNKNLPPHPTPKKTRIFFPQGGGQLLINFGQSILVYWKKIRNFLRMNSLKKISKIFNCQFHWKNNSKFFRKIRKKNILSQKQRGHRGGNPNNFSRKIRHDLSLAFDITNIIPSSMFFSTRQFCQDTSIHKLNHNTLVLVLGLSEFHLWLFSYTCTRKEE